MAVATHDALARCANLFLCLIYLLCVDNQRPLPNLYAMPISVCAVVPCDARHVRVVHEAIESLAAQTLAPTTISLRFSSMSFCPIRPKRLRKIPNLFIDCTTEHETLGVVRDEAVKLCRGEEYTTYLDGDDVALPYALERIITLMRESNATVGLHDYFGKQLQHPVKHHAELVPFYRPGALPPFALGMHMAHSTMHKSVMILHHNLTIGEDSHFIRDLWNRNATFVYTAERLTRYLDRSPQSGKKRAHRRLVPNPSPPRQRTPRHDRIPWWAWCSVGGLGVSSLPIIKRILLDCCCRRGVRGRR